MKISTFLRIKSLPFNKAFIALNCYSLVAQIANKSEFRILCYFLRSKLPSRNLRRAVLKVLFLPWILQQPFKVIKTLLLIRLIFKGTLHSPRVYLQASYVKGPIGSLFLAHIKLQDYLHWCGQFAYGYSYTLLGLVVTSFK